MAGGGVAGVTQTHAAAEVPAGGLAFDPAQAQQGAALARSEAGGGLGHGLRRLRGDDAQAGEACQ